MGRVLRAPLRALACCFVPAPRKAAAEGRDGGRVDVRDAAPRPSAAPPGPRAQPGAPSKPRAAPKPPAQWPYASDQALLAYASACAKHSPASLWAALTQATCFNQYPAPSEAVLHGLRAELAACAERHGVEPLRQGVRAWASRLQEMDSSRDTRLLALAHAALPELLPPLLTPDHAPLLRCAPVEALSAHWGSLQPEAATALAWATAVSSLDRWDAWRAFVACSATPAWGAHRPRMAPAMPRHVWALLAGPAALPVDLQGWEPGEAMLRRPLDADDIAMLSQGDDDALRAYFEAAPPEADARPLFALFDAALLLPGGSLVWRLRWALDRGHDVGPCLALAEHRPLSHSEPAQAQALLPLLARLPPQLPVPLMQVWRCLQSGCTAAQMLDFAAWAAARDPEGFVACSPHVAAALLDTQGASPRRARERAGQVAQLTDAQIGQLARLIVAALHLPLHRDAAGRGLAALAKAVQAQAQTPEAAARAKQVSEQLRTLGRLAARGRGSFADACRSLAVPAAAAQRWQAAGDATQGRTDDERLWADRVELALALSPLAEASARRAVETLPRQLALILHADPRLPAQALPQQLAPLLHAESPNGPRQTATATAVQLAPLLHTESPDNPRQTAMATSQQPARLLHAESPNDPRQTATALRLAPLPHIESPNDPRQTATATGLPPGLPRQALHLLADAACAAPSPEATRALLAVLLPHAPRLHARVRQACALAASRAQAEPWAWLEPLPSVTGPEASLFLQALVQIDTPPSEPVARWLETALPRAPRAALLPLAEWMARQPAPERPALSPPATGTAPPAAKPQQTEPLDARGLFAHHDLASLEPTPAQRADLARLFARLADPDAEAARCAAPELLPEDAWPRAARRWLQGDLPPEASARQPIILQALRACLQSAPPSEAAFAAYPELALVRHGLAGWPHLAGDATPAWLRALVKAERPAETDDAAHAQRNRMEALGRYLLACRAAELPAVQQAAQAPIVQQLLALPDVAMRHTLLMWLAGANVQDQAHVLRLQAAHPARALPLQLCAHAFLPETAAKPATQAILQARAVYTHGARARALMHFMQQTAQHSERAYAERTLGWASLTNLLRLVSSDTAALALRAAMRTAAAPQELQRAAADGPRQAQTGAADVRREAETGAANGLREAERGLALLADARAVVNASLGPSGPWAQASSNLLDGLQRALAALRQAPALAGIAERAQRLATPEALLQRKTQQLLSSLRGELRALTVAKGDAWLQPWGDALLHTLQSYVAPPPRAPAPAMSEAFFALPAIRALVHERVLPLVLALQQYAPLARQAQRAPDDFLDASAVLPTCMEWTGLNPEACARLAEEMPHLPYLAAYVASMQSHWRPADAAAGQGLVSELLRAQGDGRLNAWRRAGPQAQRVLQQPHGAALMQAWEQGAELRMRVLGAAEWTAHDTGAPDMMLAAVTQVSSCQSATNTSGYNRGMLGRLSDGGRRMLVLRDARGRIRARAALRLMLTPKQQPVLLMSPVYMAGSHADRQAAQAAAERFVRSRAGALGIPAVASHVSGVGAPLAAPRYKQALLATGGALDYWDEERLQVTAQRVRLNRRLHYAAAAS